MPAFGQDLTVQNIWDVINFLYTIPSLNTKGGIDNNQPSLNDFIQWQAPKELVDLLKVPQATQSQGSVTISTGTPIAYRKDDYSPPKRG